MLYLFIVSLVWAFSFPLIKYYLADIPSIFLASVRLFISFMFFLPFLNIRLLKEYKSSLRLIVLGMVQFGIMYIAYISSYKYLKSYEVASLTIFTPLFVVLSSGFINKKINSKEFIASIVAIVGAGIIVFKRVGLDNFFIGFILLQTANISFALGQVYYRFLKKRLKYHERELFVFIYFGAFLFTIPYLVVSKRYLELYKLSQSSIAVLLYLGIVASGLGFFLWNKGATKVKLGTLAVFNNIKIPLALLVSVFIFREKINLIRLVLGIGFMLYALRISYKGAKDD